MDADNPDIGFTWPGSMAVETGAIVNGVEVPARRAFFGFVGNDGAASLNADGVAVWDALITWLLTN